MTVINGGTGADADALTGGGSDTSYFRLQQRITELIRSQTLRLGQHSGGDVLSLTHSLMQVW